MLGTLTAQIEGHNSSGTIALPPEWESHHNKENESDVHTRNTRSYITKQSGFAAQPHPFFPGIARLSANGSTEDCTRPRTVHRNRGSPLDRAGNCPAHQSCGTRVPCALRFSGDPRLHV